MGGTTPPEQGTTPTEYTLQCPFLLHYEAKGELLGKALENLLNHVRDAHTANLSEPVRTQARNGLTACANAAGTLPI